MPSFSIWANDEDMASVKEAALKIDRSVSWYLLSLHRDSMGKNAKPKIDPGFLPEPTKRPVKKPRLSPMVEEVVIDESPMGGAERKAKISEMQSQMDRVTGSAPEFLGGYSKDRQTGKKEKK